MTEFDMFVIYIHYSHEYDPLFVFVFYYRILPVKSQTLTQHSHWGGRTKGLCAFYFTTKRLHEQYRVSSGQYRWIYCPLVQEGSIKFSVMPAGKKIEKKCFFSLNLTDFNKLFLKIDQKIEPESILRV